MAFYGVQKRDIQRALDKVQNDPNQVPQNPLNASFFIRAGNRWILQKHVWRLAYILRHRDVQWKEFRFRSTELNKWLKDKAFEVKHEQLDTQIVSSADELREIEYYSRLARKGQIKFRNLLISACNGECEVTGCDTVEALEAAHIVNHSDEQNYDVSNGILLRSDLHRLFDRGLMIIDSDTLKVSFPGNAGHYQIYAGRVLSRTSIRPALVKRGQY